MPTQLSAAVQNSLFSPRLYAPGSLLTANTLKATQPASLEMQIGDDSAFDSVSLDKEVQSKEVHRVALAERSYVLSSELGLAYQVGKLPHAALIDAAGILRARGLVNTREHVESLFEALAHGVGSVQEYVQRQADGRRVA